MSVNKSLMVHEDMEVDGELSIGGVLDIHGIEESRIWGDLTVKNNLAVEGKIIGYIEEGHTHAVADIIDVYSKADVDSKIAALGGGGGVDGDGKLTVAGTITASGGYLGKFFIGIDDNHEVPCIKYSRYGVTFDQILYMDGLNITMYNLTVTDLKPSFITTGRYYFSGETPWSISSKTYGENAPL